MAKRKLKVYRTPIGFHDAYVAAPSQKAALKAWGSDADLFARGIAELVTDPELTKEPLARPGTVVKRSRGTAAEQLAALPEDAPKPRRGRSEKAKPVAAKPRKPARRPSRDRLDAAEQALDQAEARHREEKRAIAREEDRLAAERRRLEKRHAAEREKLEHARDRVEAAYEAALRAWRG